MHFNNMLQGQRDQSFTAPRTPACSKHTSFPLLLPTEALAILRAHHTVLHKTAPGQARQWEQSQRQPRRHEVALPLEGKALTLWFPGAHTYHNHRWAERLCLSTLTAKWFQIPGQSLNINMVWLIFQNKPHGGDLKLPFSVDWLTGPPLNGKPPKYLASQHFNYTSRIY